MSEDKTMSMVHHGRLTHRDNPANSSRESSRTRAGSEQDINEPTGQPIDPEKGRNLNVVDWFDENDPEVSSC